jgi:hypothetical protein
MRALFRDVAGDATSVTAGLAVLQVGLPLNDNRRDIFIRVEQFSSNVRLRVYKTLAEARTPPGVDTLIAHATVTPGAGQQSITLTHDGTTPDMTGLVVMGVFPTMGAGEAHVWCYTASLQWLICDSLKVILVRYASTGRALESFDTNHIIVGDTEDVGSYPKIIIRPGEIQPQGSQDSGMSFNVVWPIDVAVVYRSAEDQTIVERKVGVWASSVLSILMDEYRSSLGEVFEIRLKNMSSPLIIPDLNLMASHIELDAEILQMWRDDTYPRG